MQNGWKVAPAFSPDNHHGGWGSANELRTVVLLPEKPEQVREVFNETNLLAAIRKRHVYATDSKSLVIDFRVKESKEAKSTTLAIMGDEINLTGKKIYLYIDLKDTVHSVEGFTLIGSDGHEMG